MQNFFEAWEKYHKELFWFVDYELTKQIEDFANPDEKLETKKRREFLFEETRNIQRILLNIDESSLVVEPMYHWNELKLKHPLLQQIGFKTPFSFLTHWVSIPHLNNLVNDQGFREALFISEMYLDLLQHTQNK